MLNRAVLRLLFLLPVLSAPALLHAQLQNPSPDELKMTEDPKAPGMAAVYFNVTEIADRERGFESYYARIKVLTEKGKDLATVELPYQADIFRVADIRARTIQPDGTVVPLVGKPADLLREKTSGHEEGTKVFTLPSVQVGSILEYFFKLEYNAGYVPNPYWQIQHRYPVRKAHYQCIQCSSLNTLLVLPAGVTMDDRSGNATLDLEDVPPIPDEDWMPPTWEAQYKALFYERRGRSERTFWEMEGEGWSKSVDRFVQPSNSFREIVNKLVAPGDSNIEKARKLYTAVQSLDNTDFSREKSEKERKKLNLKNVNRAEDVWTQKSGTRTEIALLYLSMLRAAGLTAYAMRVADRSERIFQPTYLEWNQLDDTIVILNIDGKELVLDPGEKMCPFLTLHWTHSGTGGLRQLATETAIASTSLQPYKANTTNRIADLTLDNHGAITGTLHIVMTGQEALYWRQKALENDETELKKQFDEWIAAMVPNGIEAHIDHFTALDMPDSNLIAEVDAHGTLGTTTSKRVFIPGLFFETRASHPFVDQAERLTPVDIHFRDTINDDVTFQLPKGMVVESAPQDNRIPWEGHAALLIESRAGPGRVNITRTLARSFTFIPTTEYRSLRDFYQKVATADQQQLVLTAAPAGKGN